MRLRVGHDALAEATVPYLHFVELEPVNELGRLVTIEEDGLLIVFELEVLDVIY